MLAATSPSRATIECKAPEVGHEQDWGGSGWYSALEQVDGWLGRIAKLANALETSEPFALVVTADHGGVDGGHGDATSPFDYTVPFYVVGASIPPHADLYTFTGSRRADPGDTRPRYAEPAQPVRNGDAANAITALLGLPPVPGSFMRELVP